MDLDTSAVLAMSQLHQEALRRQHVVDKQNVNDLSWSLPKDRSSQNLRSPFSSGIRSNTSPNSSYQGLAMGSSRGSSSKEIVITDPYLDAVAKARKARTQNRFSSTDYMMQW